MTRIARVRALAKINLDLRVLGRRSDGYHELRTVFQTVSLADTLSIRYSACRRTGMVLRGAAEIPDNLVLLAAQAVLDEARITARIEFHLRKQIPLGAGLGGGSSDAAAVLLALPVLARRPVPYGRLLGVARELGSDVPFFLLGGTAVGLGRGTELYPLPDGSHQTGVLVTSPIHVSTPEAYRALGRGLTSEAEQNTIDSFQAVILERTWESGANDFEPVVFGQFPRLGAIRSKLEKLGAATARMSGSGSSVFGLFPTKSQVNRALESFPNESAVPMSLVSRVRYRAMWRRWLRHLEVDEAWPPQSRRAT